MKNYTINEAIKLRLINVVETSYLTFDEQQILISLRKETRTLEGGLE